MEYGCGSMSGGVWVWEYEWGSMGVLSMFCRRTVLCGLCLCECVCICEFQTVAGQKQRKIFGQNAIHSKWRCMKKVRKEVHGVVRETLKAQEQVCVSSVCVCVCVCVCACALCVCVCIV